MAPPAKSTTPGRRKKSDQQYFDVGKVGRKTGITLKDTGIRDEHGLEPVSGIFSSPAEENTGKTLTSDSMDMQEGSAPDVTATLTSRKTPRLPPPRQATPKHTSIGGSPRRQSSARPVSRPPGSEEPVSSPGAHAQPPANRKLDFGRVNKDRKSLRMVDTQSPFVPKHTLRRSTGHPRPDIYDHPEDEEDVAKTSIEYTNNMIDEDEDVEESIEDNGPMTLDDGEPESIGGDQSGVSIDQAEAPAPAKRKRGRPRRSDQPNTSQIQDEPSGLDSTSTNGRKRTRASLEHSRLADTTGEERAGLSRKKKRNSNQEATAPLDAEDSVDPSILVNGAGDDGPLPDMDMEAQLNSQLDVEVEPEPSKKSKGRPKGSKKGKAAATKEKTPSQAMPNGSPIKLNESPSKLRGRGGSLGPVSNVTLRATTPFEDAGQNASRFGRNLIKPLKYWENESLIWKDGEIEGIIRAEHVDQSRPKTRRRKKSRRHKNGLRDIGEESETESTVPDEWEEAMGVITGNVANWNPDLKMGDPNDPIQEDLGFAAASIVTRDVAGSEFKYAKIMTIPFFGAGVVELPPEGYKRAKNSRKMQMVFFVHSGKVMVEVGATGIEVNQFALSKGGVWIVPRGNNYAISNESSTKAAKIFFAQGCVVEGEE